MTILSILNSLSDTDSRLEKEAIIKQNVHNDLFKKVVSACMQPMHNFHISKTPSERYSTGDIYTLSDAIDFIMDNFTTRKISGNAAKIEYATLLGTLSPDDATVLERIVKRDLRCGVKESTINNAFGYDFIYEHPNLLCSPFSTKDVEKLFAKNPWVYLQMKSDGSRCQIMVHEDRVVAYTRKGNILNFGTKLDHLIKFPKLIGQVIDGELLTRTNGVMDDRQTCNGIINKLIHGTISEDELSRVYMTAWDIFPVENMQTKTAYKVPYESRLAKLSSIVDNFTHVFGIDSFIELIETHIVHSLEEAATIYDAWMARGLEGGILKAPGLFWEDKRSKNAIKIKAEKSGEFEIIGWEYGEVGKQNEKGLGGIIVATSCRKVVTKIGKGFSQDERDTFLGFEDPDDMVGKIAECGFNSITQSKTKDTMSLFLEKFIKIRLDKTKADSLEDLQ